MYCIVPIICRLLGDLIYLDVVTLEGRSCCVTAHTRGFFVNASGGSILDHRPAHPLREAATLVALLHQLSEKFSKGMSAMLLTVFKDQVWDNVYY